MTKDAFVSTAAGTFDIAFSVFVSNRGITIKNDPSTLNVVSCFFECCLKEYGVCVCFEYNYGRSNIAKTCSRNCSLSSKESYGMFCYVTGVSMISFVSCFYAQSDTCRDVLCHNTRRQCIDSINVSHVSNKQRSFAWSNPSNNDEFTLKDGNAFNLTSKLDIIYISTGLFVCFSYFNIVQPWMMETICLFPR